MIARPEEFGDDWTPFDRVKALLQDVRETARGFRARCPVHENVGSDPSLYVDLGDDGQVLLYCHSAQCKPEDIVQKIGLEMSNLFLSGGPRTQAEPSKPPKPLTRYPTAGAVAQMYLRTIGGTMTRFSYRNATEETIGEVLRFDHADKAKDIRQSRLDGAEWVSGAMLEPRPLYRLPELLAASPTDPVLVVEGEKKADMVAALGFVVTTSSQGSQSAAKSDWTPLQGRTVVLLPDNDAPGRQYVDDAAGLLRSAGATQLRLLELEGLGDGEDVADWITSRMVKGASSEAIALELADLVLNSPEHVSGPLPAPPATGPAWPDPLGPAVRIGVLGEFLDAAETETEADPAAMVIDLLTRIGNAVHRGPCFTVSGDRHACNLFSVIVGDTAQGRKGTSAAYPRAIMQRADPLWSEQCVKNGLSSGEGLIWAVRDPTEIGVDKKTGEPIHDSGAADKRCLVIETELARTLRAAGRRENVLAPILRQAWEGGRLATMTKTPYCATDAHVSLVAHVTKHEFRQLVTDADVAGGTVNRFLLIASRRQRELPFGGSIPEADLDRIGAHLAKCIDIARRHASEMLFTSAAHEHWPRVYHDLQRDELSPGITGSLLGRATAQVRRLAMLFAIVDGCTTVDVQHLDAACEVWRYSRQTIAYVFGTSTGNKVADRILGELRGTPEGIDRTAMHKLFDRHVSSEDITNALTLLQTLGLAKGERAATAGRPKEIWVAVH